VVFSQGNRLIEYMDAGESEGAYIAMKRIGLPV
jgi:hypothetical protein